MNTMVMFPPQFSTFLSGGSRSPFETLCRPFQFSNMKIPEQNSPCKLHLFNFLEHAKDEDLLILRDQHLFSYYEAISCKVSNQVATKLLYESLADKTCNMRLIVSSGRQPALAERGQDISVSWWDDGYSSRKI